MRKIQFFPFFIIVFISGLTNVKGFGQTSATDYFRSAQSGSWDAASSWESSIDGLVSWVPASSAPNFNANTITIRSGHNLIISNNLIIDQVVVTSGGVLELATGTSTVLTVNDGSGNDIIVQNGGIFKHNITGNTLPVFNQSAILEIQAGGILEATTNNGNASGYANTASTISSNILWDDGAIFNWSNTDNPTAEVNYFPASAAIPIFRFSKPASIGGSSATIINGLLEAIADVNISNIGRKIFRNGITGIGKVVASSASVGKFIISGSTALLGGTGVLDLKNSDLIISTGTTLSITSNKTVNGTGSSTIKDSGILIADDYIINGTSKVRIDGSVKTTNVNGLNGSSNSTFATSSEFSLNSATSTVEYDRIGNQSVTAPLDCKNLIISGSGIKTFIGSSDINVAGELDVLSNNTFILNGSNNLKLNGGGTININTNAILDNGGESEISGGSGPTINIFGTFITRNANGFSDTSNSSIPGTTIKLNLLPGSTVEYGKAGQQIVSKRKDYKNITFSGSGVKIIPTCRPIGTVTIKDSAIADATNKTFGDSATNLTMTGGRLKVGGTGTKPDIAGTFKLTGGVIEFTTSGKTPGTIRSPRTYFNIEVSGSNVNSSKGITFLASGGSFTVRTGGVFENSNDRIDGTDGNQTFTMEAGSTFKTGVKGGFSDNEFAALKNIETIIINPKSTIIYSKEGDQTVTPLANYPNLLLKGNGIKTVAGGTVTIAADADSVVIDTSVVLKVSSGAKIDFQNRHVIVHSASAGTGIIGEIADGSPALLNATNVTVERFIPKRRAYRFISPSVTTTTSIKNNWMEGGVNPGIYDRVNPHPGFGTNITGRNPTTNGFDATITTNPSLYRFNTGTQKFDTVPNTKGTLSAGDAYSILIRGDRSTDMTTNTPDTTNTILRATGKLFTGPYSPALSDKADDYTFIGNPYASPVDFSKMWQNSTNVSSSYYVWDPRLNTRGAYVSYNVFDNVKSNPASDISKDIQSGQAVFVQTKRSGASIDFKENYKSTGNTRVFGRDPSAMPKLFIQLLLSDNEAPGNNADGAVSFFSKDFSTGLGDEDSYKLTNSDENLAINRNGISLSIEGRPTVTADDTIPLQIWQFRQKNYYLKLAGSNFSPELTAFLKDAYLHKETPVDLSSVTLFPFTIDTVAASSAKDRFSIVFKSNIVLPVTLTNIKAYQREDGIQVDWTAETETNIESYEVEKSTDGQTFSKATGVTAKGNNAFTQIYGWLDEDANPGNNSYRIKIIEKSGAVKYSETIDVKVINLNAGITISPNPVKSNVIILRFSNIEKGRYNVNMYNNLGQKLYNDRIEHTALSAIYTLKPERRIPKGVYRIAISKEDKTFTKTLIFE